MPQFRQQPGSLEEKPVTSIEESKALVRREYEQGVNPKDFGVRERV
jgi:hypothetical protein